MIIGPPPKFHGTWDILLAATTSISSLCIGPGPIPGIRIAYSASYPRGRARSDLASPGLSVEVNVEGSLFFVHGTGNWDNRKPGIAGELSYLTDRIRAAMNDSGMANVALHAPPWGHECGPQWPDVALVLPPPARTRSAGGPVEADVEVTNADMWELLSFDPLVELRLSALAAPVERPMLPGIPPPDALMTDLMRSMAVDREVLTDAGVSEDAFVRAANKVADSAELAAAARVAGDANPELLDVVARAVVAELLAQGRNDDSPPLFVINASARDTLLAATRAALADGTYRALFPAGVRTALASLATRVGTGWAVPRRGRWMDPVTSFSADIVFYLRHGEEVRNYLRDRLADLTPPVVAVGHSLGGVAMVDLLSSADRPEVALLVTVGSQAPYLYQLDALASLRPDAAPKPFTPWLNLYDRRDLLSFCAEQVFGIDRVTDISVDAKVPFPEAHSAYWEIPQVWQKIAEAWPK